MNTQVTDISVAGTAIRADHRPQEDQTRGNAARQDQRVAHVVVIQGSLSEGHEAKVEKTWLASSLPALPCKKCHSTAH
eukprot:646639-Pelagomonas_calceolata.AAC.4